MQRIIWTASYVDFYIKRYGPMYWLPYDKWGENSDYFSTFTTNIDEQESAWHYDTENRMSYGHHYSEIIGAYYSEEYHGILFNENIIYYNDHITHYYNK